MNNYKVTTLNDFIILKQKDFPYAKGELSGLLSHILTAAKRVNKKINKAGLVDILGSSGEVNVHGENQQKLDLYADEVFIGVLLSSGECCGVATAENDESTGRPYTSLHQRSPFYTESKNMVMKIEEFLDSNP